MKRVIYNSPTVLTFFLISLLALILDNVTGGWSNRFLFCVFRSEMSDPLQYVRLFTHVLGHANFEHFFGNFMLIMAIGPILEEKYGSGRLLRMMLITAVVTGLLNIALFPSIGLLGASGIAFMMILLASIVNINEGDIPLTFIVILLLYIGKEAYLGLFGPPSNVSNFTHIAGGLCGTIFGFARYSRKES